MCEGLLNFICFVVLIKLDKDLKTELKIKLEKNFLKPNSEKRDTEIKALQKQTDRIWAVAEHLPQGKLVFL